MHDAVKTTMIAVILQRHDDFDDGMHFLLELMDSPWSAAGH